MPPPKGPTNADVLAAIAELSVTFGAELASARAEIEKLTAEVAALKASLTVSLPNGTSTLVLAPPEMQSLIKFMPPELAKMQHINSHELALIKEDKKIQAIKDYRLRMESMHGTYVGLKEAKDLICYIADHIAYTKPVFDPANPVPMTQHQKDLVHAGKKIDAIKDYRAHVSTVCSSMCGLKEAKDVIDAYSAALEAKVKMPVVDMDGILSKFPS